MSTDTKIKNLIFNKLTQKQYNNADRVPTEFYLTPDTSIDSSEKGAANGVASLDTNGKVPTEQIPTATTSTLGGVKPDGTTITVTENGIISATGGSGSGFDFEGTKAEFDAAVAAGTITADSVSLITDDVSGDNVATKAELQAVDSSKANTSLSNLSTAGKYLASGLGMPSSRYIDLTLGASGSTYTAPANGYVFFSKVCTANGQWAYIQGKITVGGFQGYNNAGYKLFIPIKKNETFKIDYNLGGTTENFRLIYAEGAE